MGDGFAVVDLETTGVLPEVDEIYDIAVVLVDDGTADRMVSTVVRPAVDDLPPLFNGAPTLDELAQPLAELLAGRTLVAHNARFDIRLLAAELLRRDVVLPPVAGVTDTLELLRAQGVRQRKLEAACVKLGVLPQGPFGHALGWGVADRWYPWHTATFDAWMTRRLLAALDAELPPPATTRADEVAAVAELGGVPLLERRAAGIPPRKEPGGQTGFQGPDGSRVQNPFTRWYDQGVEPAGNMLDADNHSETPGKYTARFFAHDRPMVLHRDQTIDHARTDDETLVWVLPQIEALYADMGDRTLGWPPAILVLTEFARLLARIANRSEKRRAEIVELVARFPRWQWWLELSVYDHEDAYRDDHYVRQLVEHARAGRPIGHRGFEVVSAWALDGGDLDVAIDAFERQIGSPQPSRLGGMLARLLRERRRVEQARLNAALASAPGW